LPRRNKPRIHDWASREGHYGELNGNNKYTDKQARMIREYRAEGFTYTDLMKLFEGCSATIYCICHGVSYKTAGGPIEGKDFPAGRHGRSIL
jgi:hypothetical protein